MNPGHKLRLLTRLAARLLPEARLRAGCEAGFTESRLVMGIVVSLVGTLLLLLFAGPFGLGGLFLFIPLGLWWRSGGRRDY